MTMTNKKHIQLLSKTEISDLYDRPSFNFNERQLYLTINEESEDRVLSHYPILKTRVYFILQLGYFKAKHQFFEFDLEDVSGDVEYIISSFPTADKLVQSGLSGRLSRDYIRQQKNDILTLFSYRNWSPDYQAQTESHLCELLRYYPKSHNALRELLNYFDSYTH